MEKAILKTLVYGDIFDYPLNVFEIHKWLIGKKATLRQVEKALIKSNQELRIKNRAGFYFLPKRASLVAKRRSREKQSAKYLRKAKLLTYILKVIPWVKLVGISGGLAMDNATKADDIDLFVITSKNRLWISRILAIILLSLTRQRRKVGENGRKIAGKLCLNILLEEDRLEQTNEDIYLAHEVLQMKPLWYRDRIYQKYLEGNSWAFKFLPNWIGDPIFSSLRGPMKSDRGNLTSERRSLLTLRKIPTSSRLKSGLLGMTLERIAKWLQLKIMAKPQGMERIEDGALYFHPNDIRPKVLKEYASRTEKLISP